MKTQELTITCDPLICKKNSKMVRMSGVKAWIAPTQKITRQQKFLTAFFADNLKPVDGPVTIQLQITFPDYRNRDTDGSLTSVLDALVQAKIISDDNWKVVRKSSATGFYQKGVSKVKLKITQLSPKFNLT